MTKKTKKPKPYKSEQAEPNFNITIKLGNETYQGTGATALEALTSIKKPLKIMSKGIVLVESGGKKKEILMMPLRLRRLFFNPLFQAIQVKWLASGLK